MGDTGSICERIRYTASLATDFRQIDPLLETFRAVTAHIDVRAPLSPADHAALIEVQQRLEMYLVEKEAMRQFTPESLQLQIEQHMQGGTGRKSKRQLYMVLVAAMLLSFATVVLPLHTLSHHILVGGATLFSVVMVGAAWLFFTALPAFKSQLRSPFLMICSAMALLGLSMLMQPVIEIFSWRQYPVVSLLYPLPILLAAIVFHLGDVFYVRQLSVQSKWTTAKPVLLSMVVIAAITCLLPHLATAEPEWLHDVSAILWGCMFIMPLASAIVLNDAVGKLPELYKVPMRSLRNAMYPIMLVIAYQYVVRIIAGPYLQGWVAYVFFACVFLMSMGLLHAGYTLNKVSRY